MFPQGTNTYVGLIVSIAPLLLSVFHVTPTPAFNAEFPATVAAIISLIGAGYAFYGRARATVPGWFAKA